MGLFDTLTGHLESASTASVAVTLRAPVLLVVDAAALGQSIAAVVHGFRAYDEVLPFGGVILNGVASDRHEQLLREALDDIGVPVFGALRRGDLAAALPPRHHGVVPVAHRSVEALRAVRRLGEVAAALDLDRILAVARTAPALPDEPWTPASAEAGGEPPRRPVIAVAGTAVLPYAYAETVELLAAAGATVAPVDPLRDETLPDGTDALVIGAALPETYAEELAANRRLSAQVAELARSGAPVLAEGTGLLWLAREFDGRPMAGVLDAVGESLNRPVIGYREATAQAATAVARFRGAGGRPQTPPGRAGAARRADAGVELGRRAAGGVRVAPRARLTARAALGGGAGDRPPAGRRRSGAARGACAGQRVSGGWASCRCRRSRRWAG